MRKRSQLADRAQLASVPPPALDESARRAKERTPAAPFVFDADVDGARVRIKAKDEVVIECGKAMITLRRNGRVIIRGTHVETCSTGTNRIKGGQVRVN
jgi:hypothetical protein